jgi:hypothetical protein
MGCLTGSSYGDIAHRDQGEIKTGGLKKSIVIEAVPDPDYQAVEPGKRDQNDLPGIATGFIHAK